MCEVLTHSFLYLEIDFQGFKYRIVKKKNPIVKISEIIFFNFVATFCN